MERLNERIKMANKALTALRGILSYHEVTDVVKDAAIQRFEFTFEASWKAAKQYLYDVEGLDIGSPKGVIRNCRKVGLFNDKEAVDALKMVDDRNLTVQTYNEELSFEIFQRIPNYYGLMEKWIDKINEGMNSV
jgi:nucleotidyltransferase substrate binding protein (TIGR01987 family)